MKHPASLAALPALLLTLTACGASPPPAPEEPPASQEPTLEALCGADYQSYIVETITMQMENRMNKTPDIPYFPIADGAPLTDYAAIDKTTVFEVDKEGNVVIYFSAGTVTDEANGGQSFRIPLP